MANGNPTLNPFNNYALLAMLSFCFPKLDLLQALTTVSDSQLIDKIGTRSTGENQTPQGLLLDGSTNYIEYLAGTVGDTVTYTKTDNTTDTTVLDASKQFFVGVGIRIFNFTIGTEVFNLEEKGGLLYSETGAIAELNGSGLLTTCLVEDFRKGYSKAQEIGYGLYIGGSEARAKIISKFGWTINDGGAE